MHLVVFWSLQALVTCSGNNLHDCESDDYRSHNDNLCRSPSPLPILAPHRSESWIHVAALPARWQGIGSTSHVGTQSRQSGAPRAAEATCSQLRNVQRRLPTSSLVSYQHSERGVYVTYSFKVIFPRLLEVFR